jgi:thiosulfate dehydrogenase (quinone) large subunit
MEVYMAVNNSQNVTRRHVVRLEDPPVARLLFDDVRLSPLWLVLRLYLAWQWLESGIGKVQNPAWVGPTAGGAINGFVAGALKKTAGDHPDVPGWYAWFLQHVVQPNAGLWSNLVAYGELAVGIALVLGIFTGIAAFFGGFMNFNYLLAGTVSVNPMMFLIAGLLVLAWKTAGWLGVDRVLLPALGTPWAPGRVFGGETPLAPPVTEPDRTEV